MDKIDEQIHDLIIIFDRVRQINEIKKKHCSLFMPA